MPFAQAGNATSLAMTIPAVELGESRRKPMKRREKNDRNFINADGQMPKYRHLPINRQRMNNNPSPLMHDY
jgi:hypothetical protein